MSWADLFDRADGFEVSEATVVAALARRREREEP